MGSFGDKQIIRRYPQGIDAIHFFDQNTRIDHRTVSDDTFRFGVEDS